MSEAMDQRIFKVVGLMRDNIHLGVSLEALAQAVNLSPSRLHQVFKDETGMSPAKYLKVLRLEQAKTLLEGSFLSVKEIRGRVGFGDQSHFARDFKAHFGLTPTEYRARHFSGDGDHGGDADASAPEPSVGTPPVGAREADDACAAAAPARDGAEDALVAFALPAFG